LQVTLIRVGRADGHTATWSHIALYVIGEGARVVHVLEEALDDTK
jgi:hypothetical protein